MKKVAGIYNMCEQDSTFNLEEYKDSCFQHLASLLNDLKYEDISYKKLDASHEGRIVKDTVKVIQLSPSEVFDGVRQYITNPELEGEHTIKHCGLELECDKLRSAFGYGEFPFLTIYTIAGKEFSKEGEKDITCIFYTLDR